MKKNYEYFDGENWMGLVQMHHHKIKNSKVVLYGYEYSVREVVQEKGNLSAEFDLLEKVTICEDE